MAAGAALGAVRADHGGRGGVGNGQLVLQAIIARHGFGIAAQQNVGSAAGHVGRNRDRAFASRLRDDFRFALVLLGVQNLVRDARFLQQVRQMLRFLNGNGADQHRLAGFVNLADAVRVASCLPE